MQSVGSTKRTNSPFWDGVLFFLSIVMAINVLAYAMVILLHVAVKHTYFDPASPIGVLVSDRYVSFGWWMLALSVLPLWVPALLYFVWTDIWLQKPGWAYLWTVCIALLVIAQFVVVVHFASARSNCNGQGQSGNPCNDILWCCVP